MDLAWDNITEEELKRLYYEEDLSDTEIAHLYGVPKNKVTYKRNKFNISFRSKAYQKLMNQDSELLQKLNSDSKKRLMKRENIDSIAKAITHFVFRNGPVEDMHANNQLSQEDMKILNKFMVNRVAGLLTTIADNNWLHLELLLGYYNLFGINWDKVEPDIEAVNAIFRYTIEDMK